MIKCENLMNIGEFAGRTGLTVRTIRFYDKKGLLKPSRVAESGYRQYREEDFWRLEQILTLKFMGFSLEEIKKLMNRKKPRFRDALSVQRQAVKEKIDQLQRVLVAIEKAESSIIDNNEVNWENIIYIIRSLKMEDTGKWAEQFYTQDQLDKLKNMNYTPEQAQADAKRWEDLIGEVRANKHLPPDSPEMQALADRWLGLINEFTQGDPGMQQNLNNVWSNVESGPEEFRAYYDMNRDVFETMQKVLSCRK